MIVSKPLQFFHGLGGIFLVHKRHKGKTARYHRFLVLRQIHARNTSKGLKQILQIGFRRIFGNIRDTNGIQIVRALRNALGGHAGRRGRTTALRGRHVLATRRGSSHLRPSTGTSSSCQGSGSTAFFIGAIDIVFAFQLTALLFGPKGIQVTCQCFGGIIVLQIRIGIWIFHNDIVARLNGHVTGIFIQSSLTKFLPLAALRNGHGFLHGSISNPEFRSRFDQLTNMLRMSAVRSDNLNAFCVDFRLVCGWNVHIQSGGSTTGSLWLLFVIGIIQIISPT
mmetsp:Transcript_3445/g.5735  ORF Transcript_3445/g.5735 Transcript_3445/m.5735 type:complete len:280 (+) Transcript_3445:294-1133(+)